MNYANFSYDCRNNAENCDFQPVYDEIEELSYKKRYQNVFKCVFFSPGTGNVNSTW